MNLLLISSSRVGNSAYLENAVPMIQNFLGELDVPPNGEFLFIPYAGISLGFDEYLLRIKTALAKVGINIIAIHQSDDMKLAIENASGIIVGGGNTFSLLNSLYEEKLMAPIRDLILAGKPYIGWSAGSNIVAPSIKTTNDMPIVEPESFQALNLIPWQINPHFIDGNPPGHNGETRDQRIEEFLIENPDKKVIALPEGTALKCVREDFKFVGESTGFVFSKDSKKSFTQESDLHELLDK